MAHTKKIEEENLARLHDQALYVLTLPKVQSHWNSTGPMRDQLIYRLGHSFTTLPRFGDGVHDELTRRMHDTMRKAGCTPADIEGARFSIDREAGDMTVDLRAGSHARIVEKLAAYREQHVLERSK